jgi:hypothetical protein
VKRNNNPQTNNDQIGKTGKARSPVQRDAKEVMAELVARLSEKLEPRAEKAGKADGLQDGVHGSQSGAADSGCGPSSSTVLLQIGGRDGGGGTAQV